MTSCLGRELPPLLKQEAVFIEKNKEKKIDENFQFSVFLPFIYLFYRFISLISFFLLAFPLSSLKFISNVFFFFLPTNKKKVLYFPSGSGKMSQPLRVQFFKTQPSPVSFSPFGLSVSLGHFNPVFLFPFEVTRVKQDCDKWPWCIRNGKKKKNNSARA